MTIPNDLKIMTQYRNYKLKFPIYTSQETQQIYDCCKNIKTYDVHGRINVHVIDDKNICGICYKQFRKSALLKTNGDFINSHHFIYHN